MHLQLHSSELVQREAVISAARENLGAMLMLPHHVLIVKL